MIHLFYEKYSNKETLYQGDILNPESLKNNLIGHQDYFANQPHFYRYMVLTQTCDLTWEKQRPDFIFLAVVRKFREAISMYPTSSKRKQSTKRKFQDLFNHNINKRGFFYLPKHELSGMDEEGLVDLRVMFSLHKSHYPDLVKARIGSIKPLYSSLLGHMVGHMFNRVAVEGWEGINPGETAEEKAEKTFLELKNNKEKRLEELKAKTNGSCLFCSNDANDFRKITVSFENLETRKIDCVMCQDHINQWDNNTFIENGSFREIIQMRIDEGD